MWQTGQAEEIIIHIAEEIIIHIVVIRISGGNYRRNDRWKKQTKW
jgi:hypothetical protein